MSSYWPSHPWRKATERLSLNQWKARSRETTWLRKIFCRHEYYWVGNVPTKRTLFYADFTTKYALCVCDKCKKVILEEYLSEF